MTKLQMEKIITLRQQTATYATISEALGIPVGTIKTFCRRNGITTDLPKGKYCCKNCGEVFASTGKTKPRVFCSDQCKIDWWNNHRGERKSANILLHTCPVCGKKFTAYAGANRKYCSQACYRGGVADEA